MGKAARNRAKRKNEAALEQQLAAVQAAIEEILGLQDVAALKQVLERRPELLGEMAIEEVRRIAQSPGYGPLIALVLHLVEDARDDPQAAWEAFARARETAAAAGRDLGALDDEIDAARDAGELSRALDLIEPAVVLAREIGYGLSVCDLLTKRGLLLVELNTADRASEIEAALQAFEEALEVALHGEQAARILMLRGLAYSERVNGDPAQNTDRSIVSVQDGLRQLEDSENDGLRAMMQTNLAVAMIRRRHDRAAAARAAADLCRQALTYRSPARDAGEWAYSQINLGYALQTLAELGEAELGDARAAYEEVLAHSDSIADGALLGSAHQALGRLELQAARNSPEEMVEAHAEGSLDELFDTTAALHSAREHLQAALELTPKVPDPFRYARILDDLSNALDQLGHEDEALAFAQEALGLVTPDSAPVVCKEVGWRVGALLSRREDWEGAATAFRAAVAAAELTLNARIDTAARAQEIRSAGNLHRWAAYALARIGDAEGAALTLDSGRARELQRRLGRSGSDDPMLAQVPQELRDRYLAALADFVASPIDGADTAASRRLGVVIAAVRELPGLSHFRAGPQWAEITAAVEPGRPIVYVNPTPQGTLLLLLHERAGGVSAEAQFIEVNSTDVWMHLFVGGDDLDAAIASASGSYLIAASGQGDDDDVGGNLDQLLPWLGETIVGPLANLLRGVDATGATLVLCGPLDLAPLHAAPSGSNGETLADWFELRYAPSATVCGAALGRAQIAAGMPRRLIALADPLGDLPAARPEVEEIAELFDAGASTCAIGSAATTHFLKRHAPQASHLHLACHARGGLFDAGEAAISLASGLLPAAELTAVVGLRARLVVVSACQSAQSTMGGLVHAEFSIAAAALAAGSACAIASLWPVDDLATALLMTRLYQELLVGESAPPQALRAAQRWLRDLSDDEEQQFLNRHPQLAAEHARRVAEGDLPGRRGAGFAGGPPSAARPYAHPEFWAPFIAVGV